MAAYEEEFERAETAEAELLKLTVEQSQWIGAADKMEQITKAVAEQRDGLLVKCSHQEKIIQEV